MPPPPPPTPTVTRAAGRQHSPLLRLIFCTLLALIVFFGAVVLIIWLTVHPRKFKYSIEQGSISGFNLTRNDRLTADFQFFVRANNPNRRTSVYYDKIDATVSYDDQVLSTASLPPFHQPRRNVTQLDLHLKAAEAALYGAVARDLRMERAAREIGVDLRIRANIRLKIGVFKIHRKLNVLCGPAIVPFNSSKGFERVYCEVDFDD
ncbi:Late embryogenesis abundant (LEA) hydroxyproline-rich glycoprotein family [Striga hermonthica]|uniref:Late embryogenesis abundant (LEA) hydroxyproline-rich glycoprotein family n=1 Tax=Striga hermonthica TaxID=68872 RepID=A0A9N7MTA5_STRHE|nr:Late embryogenesis abundant (LEA) hydroxyproline-rich glycoprotein family [Striga hermonthica]